MRAKGNKAIKCFEGQGEEFMLNTGVRRKIVEGTEENCHMVWAAREVDGFGSRIEIRKPRNESGK